MGNRNIGTLDPACGDWVPPPELQERWQSAPIVSPNHEKQKLLETIIERDVIPRLLLANRAELAIAPPMTDQMAAKLAERVGEFSELVVERDADDSVAFFQSLRDGGASLESLFQDLLAPTARRLGVLWEEDINDFLDVTRGIGHLQHIVRTFSEEFCSELRMPLSTKRTLLMPVPGEQHTFGLSLLREHFLREGWRVWCGPSDHMSDIVKLVTEQWFDMLGLSASVLKDPEQLAKDIRLLRKASVNRQIRIFVGGLAFDTTPDLVTAVGADATARDGRRAVIEAAKATCAPE